MVLLYGQASVKIWTSTLAPCQTHYLPVELTSTDSNFVNVTFMQRHFRLYIFFSCLILSGLVLQGAKGLLFGQKMGKIGDLKHCIDRK